MERKEIFGQLEEVFRELFDEYDGPIDEGLTAKDVEQWDSLGHVQLMVLVEKTCGVRFELEEINNLANLGELVALIAEKRGNP